MSSITNCKIMATFDTTDRPDVETYFVKSYEAYLMEEYDFDIPVAKGMKPWSRSENLFTNTAYKCENQKLTRFGDKTFLIHADIAHKNKDNDIEEMLLAIAGTFDSGVVVIEYEEGGRWLVNFKDTVESGELKLEAYVEPDFDNTNESLFEK